MAHAAPWSTDTPYTPAWLACPRTEVQAGLTGILATPFRLSDSQRGC